jgi:hypothetical protein
MGRLNIECKSNLGYGEEVHWSINLREWSNLIGYEMASLSVGVYNMASNSPVENFKHERKLKMTSLPTWQHFFFAKGVLQRSSYSDNLNPSNKKHGLLRTSTSYIVLIIFPVLSATPTVVSNM